MAYEIKFQGSFKDKTGQTTYQVDLLYDTLVKPEIIPLVLVEAPLFTKYLQAEKAGDSVVLGSESTVTFVVAKEDLSDYSSLFTAVYKNWRMDIYDATESSPTLLWTGWIQPENLNKQEAAYKGLITVSATDGLCDLEDIVYSNYPEEEANYSTGFYTQMDCIKNALAPLGFELDFLVKLNRYETNESGTELCLLNIYVNTFRFKKSIDGRASMASCLSVLEQILGPYNCIIQQINGKYRIRCLDEKDSYDYVVDWDTLTQQSRTATDDVVDVSSKKFSSSPTTSMIAPATIDVTHRNRYLGTSLVADLNLWTESGGPWETDHVGDYSVADGTLTLDFDEIETTTVSLDSTFSVSRNGDNDYLRIRFSYRTSNWSDELLEKVYRPTIQVWVKKPNEDWEKAWEQTVFNTWGYFESQNYPSYWVAEDGDYDVKIVIIEEDEESGLTFSVDLQDVDITKVTVIDGEEVEDVTFDRFYRTKCTTDEAKAKKEVEMYFGDSLQIGDIGALYRNGGDDLTLLWNRMNGETDELPLLELYGLRVLSDRSVHKQFIRSVTFENTTDLLPDTIAETSIDSVEKNYTFNSFAKNYQMNSVEVSMEERIYGDVSYATETTDLDTVDGSSTGSSASVTGGSISETERSRWNTAYSQRAYWDGGSTDLVAATGRASLGLVIGTNVQAHSARLGEIAALSVADGNIIVGNGSSWVAESGATARTSLGLGTGNSPQFTAINIGHATDTTLTRVSAGVAAIEGKNIYLAGGADVAVADGGTGQSTLTANRVLVGNGANGILSPSNFYWDNTAGKIGISTTTTSYGKITIGADGATNGLTFYDGDDTTFRIYRDGDVAYLTRGTTLGIAIDNAGKVGIGIAAPSNPFHIYNTGADNIIRVDGDAGYHQGIFFHDSADRWLMYKPASTTDLSFYAYGSGAGRKVTFKQDGKVGIGKTDPEEKLHVYGIGETQRIKIESGDGNPATLKFKNTEGEFQLFTNDGELYIYDAGDSAYRFTIDTDGYVGIGTTDPDGVLHTVDTVGRGLTIQRTGAATGKYYLGIQYASNKFGIYDAVNDESIMVMNTTGVGIGDTSPSYKLDVNGTGRFTGQLYANSNLTVTGYVTATGEMTAYYSSDIRLKENINPLCSSLSIIDSLNPVSFDWNETAKKLNPTKDNRVNYGLIAQELKQIMPELVHPIYENYLSIDYVQLIPILIGAVKELSQEIILLKGGKNG